MSYDIFKPWLTLDPWQKEYIEETEKNCFLLCGRQSGKSAAASIKFGKLAVTQPNKIILMLAFTQDQAYLLFFKTLMYLEAVYPKMIKRGNDKPTKHIIHLKNNSKIMCYAAGLAGEGIRGHTVTNLVIDEAAAMAREVFTAVTPMLSVTGGKIDLLSTPRGKAGYFYECSDDPSLKKVRKDFKRFYVSGEDCPRHTKEFLEIEKETKSELEYAQEYLAKFLDDLKRLFTDEWIAKVCTLKRERGVDQYGKYFLGVDIARMGNDESTFEVLRKLDNKNIIQTESIITKKTLTTDTEDRIVELQKVYNFKKIGIDAGSGSLGVGVLDHLLRISETKNKVEAINNRARSLDRDDKSKTKMLKEDLYNNLLALGSRGEIKLLDDDEVKASLRSIQYEHVIKAKQPTKVRIFGNYSHVAEGLIRAAILANDKINKLWVRWS